MFFTTRDSKIWTLMTLGAILGYLSTTENPMTWDYAQWIQAGLFIVAWATGKLANSPLKGVPSALPPPVVPPADVQKAETHFDFTRLR